MPRLTGWKHDDSLEERIWRHVEKSEECWLWTGSRDTRGYGRVCWNHKTFKAHRLLWEATYGPIPEGLFICHHCDTPACVRPSHLFLGTSADNNADMNAKGRHYHGDLHWTKRSDRQEELRIASVKLIRKGESSNKAKVTENQVRAIRVSEQEGISMSQLGKEYGITRATVRAIVIRRTWSHVE